MDHWGYSMLSAVEVLSEMVAIGFEMPKNAFTSLIKGGPHLLAPTVIIFSFKIRRVVI